MEKKKGARLVEESRGDPGRRKLGDQWGRGNSQGK